ncbi:BrnA antitoxin family protein [Candidatus Palauibacter sp.]|uniref:BrnA antitoxin family protein n=1 Tax=Candidatus Palauibacter sp. TaxID=3101350 RepID=UPI003AF2DA4E
MEVEWDETRNQTNIRKHGIGFDTARRIFEGTVATSPDRRRDYGEDRHISIGRVESIDFSDIPELDEEFWERAKLVEPDRTDQITMRVKRSVLAYFKAPGKGYQTRMNRVLESYVRHRTGESADTGEGAGH